MLVLSDDAEALERERAGLAARFPELAPEWLEGAALADAEPGLGDGLFAYRLATGRPVPPAAAAAAWAERARAAGAELRIGVAVEAVEHASGRVTGVRTSAGAEPAGAVAIAAGPWTAGARERPGRAAVGRQRRGAAARRRRGTCSSRRASTRSPAPAAAPGRCSASSRRAACPPSARRSCARSRIPAAVAPRLLERGARYLPALASPGAFSARACPRPQSRDGLPILGPYGEVEGLYVASGHGAWGISLGPGSAELVAAAILGDGGAIPPELAASRLELV